MNYKQNYFDYITYVKTLNRSKNDNVYYEQHHITPKCMNGTDSNENLILLTAREHYLAHYLLMKMYPNNKKLIDAFIFMSGRCHFTSSRLYSSAKKRFASMLSKEFKGNNNPFYGKHHSENVKKRISLAKMGETPWNKGKHQTSTEGKNNPRARKIVCINTQKVFNTVSEAQRWSGIKSHGNICDCCKGLIPTAGKHPITKEKLRWKYA